MQIPSRILYHSAKAGIFLIGAMPQHRKTAELQMRQALGDDYNRSLPLKVFMHHGRVLVDAIRYAGMDTDSVHQSFEIEGREHLDAALASPRGVMLIEGHLGNWEMTPHLPRVLGFACDIIMNERKNPGIEALIQELRDQPGVTKLPPKGGVMKAMIATLRAGHTVFMAADQRGPRGNTLVCNFFDLPALTSPVPAYIAIKGDALIVPVSIIYMADRYRVRFEAAIDPRDICPNADALTGLRQGMQTEPVERLSTIIQDWLVAMIRQYPTQWIWLYSRWTRRSEMRRLLREGGDFRAYIRSQAERINQRPGTHPEVGSQTGAFLP